MTEAATAPSTDLEPTGSTDIGEAESLEQLEARAGAAAKRNLAGAKRITPRLYVVQGTTKNPPADAKPGDFVNSITGQVYGPKIEFLVGHYETGRFYGPRDAKGNPTGEAFVAGPDTIVPGNWPENFRGRVFAELPEAKERFQQLVNDGTIDEWGSGPPIQTTHNYVGVVIDPAPSGEQIPVRLSLKSSDEREAKQLNTLITAPVHPWDNALALYTERKQFDQGAAFVIRDEGYGAEPENDDRRRAAEIALYAEQGNLVSAGDDKAEAQAPRKPREPGTGPSY